jgi:O-antigen/teichoic acid export membrane protein
MARSTSLLRGGVALGCSQGTAQSCSFLKSVILARLISVSDFGVAAAFAMALSLLEMLSNLSSDKLLVQASDGDEPRFQGTAHFIHLLRGFNNGAMLFLFAGPIARLFGVPQAVWSFRGLALLPILRGLAHLDYTRLQREMRFGPSVRIEVISNLLAVALAYPVALWFRSYSAMLVLLLLQAAVWSLGSHLVAERRYACAWNRHYAKRMFAFGWPLLFNGLLLYGIMQGDRVLIGSAKQLFRASTYTLADLGVYSVAFSITMAPTMFVSNVATPLFLPVLAKVKDYKAEFEKDCIHIFGIICLAATVTAVQFITVGPELVVRIYGPKYTAAGRIIGWLGAMWGLRTIRTAPILAALSQGDTRAALMGNLVRTAAFGGVLYAAATGADLRWVAISGFLGEVLALPAIMFRVGTRQQTSLIPYIAPLSGFAVSAALALSLTLIWRTNSTLHVLALKCFVSVAIAGIPMMMLVPGLRADLQALWMRMASQSLSRF